MRLAKRYAAPPRRVAPRSREPATGASKLWTISARAVRGGHRSGMSAYRGCCAAGPSNMALTSSWRCLLRRLQRRVAAVMFWRLHIGTERGRKKGGLDYLLDFVGWGRGARGAERGGRRGGEERGCRRQHTPNRAVVDGARHCPHTLLCIRIRRPRKLRVLRQS